MSQRRDGAAARAFFARALRSGPAQVEVTTDRAPVYPRVLNELVPAARHVLEQYTNDRVESDHACLKARLWLMRGLKTIRSLRTVAAGHAFVQNLRRGHYDSPPTSPPMIESGLRSTISRVASDATPRAVPGDPAAILSLNATDPGGAVSAENAWWVS